MTISVVACHIPINKEIDEMWGRCLKSIRGQYDELIMIINDTQGFGHAYNSGFKQATGDFIVAVSDDTTLDTGTLKDLCDPKAVTYSKNSQWGCFFCLPRWVYEKQGGFDESFGECYFEDNDYIWRLKLAGIPVKRTGIEVTHIGGVTEKALGREQSGFEFGALRWMEKYGEKDPNDIW